jgi:hypothetical protein
MGIRFACHACGKRLNIKRDLAGKRGVCPSCSNRFRIPWEDSEKSIPLESAVEVGAAAMAGGAASTATMTAGAQLAAAGGAVASPQGSSTSMIEEALADTDHSAVKSSTSLIEEALADTPTTSAIDLPSSLLDEDPAATWYVRPPSGGQYGPASSEILREWIAQGRVASTALIWRDGWPLWREASETLPELTDRLPSGSVTSGASSTASPPHHRTPSSSTSPQLPGPSTTGTDRRSRSRRRVMLIGGLVVVAVALIVVLVIVANR